MRIQTTTTSLCCAAASIAVGLVGWQMKTPSPSSIVEACTATGISYHSMEDFVQQTGYQPYNSQAGLVLGDSYTCILTQRLYQATAAELVLLGTKLLWHLLVMTITVIEAGRQGNRGLLLWPTLFGILYYCFGTSVVFPSFWVPSYCLLGNTSGGSTDGKRGPIALLISLPPILCFAITILCPKESSLWNTSAAWIASPAMALLPLACWKLTPPKDEEPIVATKDTISSAKSVATTYAVVFGISFVGWIAALSTYLTKYGLLEWESFWTEGDPAIAVEIASLWLGCMILLVSRSEWGSLEAVCLAPLVGPGAAIAVELAALELEKYSIPIEIQPAATTTTARSKKKKKKKN